MWDRYVQLRKGHKAHRDVLLRHYHAANERVHLKLDDYPQLYALLRCVDLREVHRLREDEIQQPHGGCQRCG